MGTQQIFLNQILNSEKVKTYQIKYNLSNIIKATLNNKQYKDHKINIINNLSYKLEHEILKTIDYENYATITFIKEKSNDKAINTEITIEKKVLML